MPKGGSDNTFAGPGNSMILQRFIRAYLFLNGRIWRHLPESFRRGSVGRAYGRYLHALVCRHSDRKQNHSTFFLRNRPELELMRLLLDQKPHGSSMAVSVLACSKGAEVYSFLWTIRSTRSDLKVNTCAVDISQEILDFAEKGVYSRESPGVVKMPRIPDREDLTWRDQPESIFDRMTNDEVEAMFELDVDHARVKSWLKKGITWIRGDVTDPNLINVMGPQDIVVANRFLCHMAPSAAENCLRSIASMVKPGGFLFVSGVDLEVRARVAMEMRWTPITTLIKEIHEGDISLRNGWPLGWWGIEPFCDDQSDWKFRYASVFQIGNPRADIAYLRGDPLPNHASVTD